MKKHLSLFLAMIMVLSLAACGGQSAPSSTPSAGNNTPAQGNPPAENQPSDDQGAAVEYNTITLKFGTASAKNSITADAFEKWGENLREATDGKVDVQVYPGSTLGSSAEMTQGAQLGTIDVVVIQPAGLADMGATKMNLFSLPYLFSNYDQYYNTLYGEIGDELLQDVTDNVEGLVGFSYIADGGRCYFTTKKAITSLDDIKGMKLRVQSYAIDSSTAEVLGFSATPTALSELYQALQNGLVDGAEQPLSAIDGNGFYEVSDYLCLDNHTFNMPTLVISQKTWDSLNEDTHEIMRAMWKKTVEEFFRPQLVEYEAGLLKKFEEAGVEIVELTDYDRWVEAVKPVWDEYGAGLEDMIAEVQATK